MTKSAKLSLTVHLYSTVTSYWPSVEPCDWSVRLGSVPCDPCVTVRWMCVHLLSSHHIYMRIQRCDWESVIRAAQGPCVCVCVCEPLISPERHPRDRHTLTHTPEDGDMEITAYRQLTRCQDETLNLTKTCHISTNIKKEKWINHILHKDNGIYLIFFHIVTFFNMVIYVILQY